MSRDIEADFRRAVGLAIDDGIVKASHVEVYMRTMGWDCGVCIESGEMVLKLRTKPADSITFSILEIQP